MMSTTDKNNPVMPKTDNAPIEKEPVDVDDEIVQDAIDAEFPNTGGFKNCEKCGAKIPGDSNSCPNCGIEICEVDVESDGKKEKKVPIVWIVVAVIVAIVLAVAIGMAVVGNMQAQEAEHEQQANIQTMSTQIDLYAPKAEGMCKDIMALWLNSILDDGASYELDRTSAILPQYEYRECCSSDFSLAIYLYSQKDEVKAMKANLSMAQVMVQNAMDGIEDPKTYQIQGVQAFKELVGLASDPSGSYTTYSSSVNDAVSDLSSVYSLIQSDATDNQA